ncbi:MAG: hypothetical protein NTY38_18160 [Acidobacteria bacterium]|nr:hypothetical protein [Acidobacteriota bacterium]
MKAIRLLSLLALILLGATLLSAADVTGKWTGEVQGRNGKYEITLNLKADGAALTGTVTGRAGENPISDGKIDGDTISFTQSIERDGNKMTWNYKGTVAGDEIKMTRAMGERSTEFTVKRAK